MRFIYLLSFRYSLRGILRELILAFLAFLVAFTFTYAVSYVFEGGKYERYVARNFAYSAAAVFPKDEVGLLHEQSVLANKRPEEDPNYAAYLETMRSLPDLKGIGAIDTMRADLVVNSTQYDLQLHMFNQDMMAYAPIPLGEGSWDTLLQYDNTDEEAVIPCVVTAPMAETYPVGSTIELELDFATGLQYTHTDEDGLTHAKVLSDKHMRTFRVAGVISREAFVYSELGVGTGERPIDLVLCNMADMVDLTTMEIIYTPVILRNGSSIFPEQGMTSYYLFSGGAMEEDVVEWETRLKEYAGVSSFDEMIEIYNQQFDEGGGDIYFLHAAIAALLLLLGIGGYNIMLFSRSKRMYGVYFMCGMKWPRTVAFTLASNALVMLLPAALGAAAGLYEASGIRTFMPDTRVLSILSGVGSVAALYLITSLIFSVVLLKTRPKSLLEEE